LLARLPNLPEEMSERLRAILAPAAASHPQGRRSWRNWIDTLPDSGTDLWERALGERYRLRRRRLFVLAAIRDGASVERAAKSAGMRARTVYRLLDHGARCGLEAALERPQRGNKLTGAQAEALGQWIVVARARQNRRAVTAQALTMFGVSLNTDEAYAVLRVHRHAGPGRRRRLWKPKPLRCTIRAEPNHDSAPSS
jgi:transposase